MDVNAAITAMGWVLPAVSKPIAVYVPAVRTGNLLFVSGQLPWRDGALLATGAVPSATSMERAQQAAAQCALAGLAVVHAEVGGDWDRLVRAVRLGAFVLSDPGFTEQAKVANGASELLGNVLGDAGRHARAAVGVNALPLNASVEIEFIFELRD